MIRRLLIAGFVGIVSLMLVRTVSADQPANVDGPGSIRRYRDGPLAAEDFQAAVPKDAQWDAFTKTDLRFQVRFQTKVRGNHATAVLTSIDLFAVVLPGESWIVNSSDKQLLNHAQGHFDIYHIAALRGSLELAKMLKSGKPPTGTGRTENDAVADLERTIRVSVKQLMDSTKKEGEKYDRATRHGKLRSRLAQQRRKQRQQIDELNEQLQ